MPGRPEIRRVIFLFRRREFSPGKRKAREVAGEPAKTKCLEGSNPLPSGSQSAQPVVSRESQPKGAAGVSEA